jgi:hypothetical protein
MLKLVKDNLSTEEYLKDLMFIYGFKNYQIYDINEINTIDTFFYIKSHIQPICALVTKENYIPSLVKEKLNSHKNLNLIFLDEHESDHDDVADVLFDTLQSESISPNQIYVVNNNSKIKELCETKGINGITTHRIFTLYARDFNQYQNDFTPNKEYLFMCHNRIPKPQRVSVLCLLKKMGLLDNIDWSFIRGFQFRNNHTLDGKIDPFFFRNYFTSEQISDLKEEIEFFRNIDVKKSVFEESYIFDNPLDHIIDFDLTYKINSYSHSYINLALETHFELKQVIHITEKSLKPIFFLQIPLILATQNHVKELRSVHGFDMFDDLIDHSYDSICDNKERFDAYIKEVLRLNSMKEHVIDFYQKNKQRFLNNREIINNFNVGLDDYNFLKNLSEI